RLAAAMPNVFHVDLRSTVQEGDWWDELHPGGAAAQRLAALFRAAIAAASAQAVPPPAQPQAPAAGPAQAPAATPAFAAAALPAKKKGAGKGGAGRKG